MKAKTADFFITVWVLVRRKLLVKLIVVVPPKFSRTKCGETSQPAKRLLNLEKCIKEWFCPRLNSGGLICGYLTERMGRNKVCPLLCSRLIHLSQLTLSWILLRLNFLQLLQLLSHAILCVIGIKYKYDCVKYYIQKSFLKMKDERIGSGSLSCIHLVSGSLLHLPCHLRFASSPFLDENKFAWFVRSFEKKLPCNEDSQWTVADPTNILWY